MKQEKLSRSSSHRSSRLALLCRTALVIAPLLLLTQCFQISHLLDLRDDGTLDVRWVFRFSKEMEQVGGNAGEKKDGQQNLGDMVESGKKNLPESFKGLVQNLLIQKVESDYDSGMVVSFQVAQYAKFPYEKMKKEEFPIIPRYSAEKKELLFHFEPMKKEDQKEPEKKEPEKKDAQPQPAAVEGAEGAGAGEEMPAQDNQMEKQITRLFLSSVRYQILLGKKFNIARAVCRKGGKEKVVDVLKAGDVSIVDIPLFAMYGDMNEPFDLVMTLK